MSGLVPGPKRKIPTLATNGAHDDVDGILALRPTRATVKHHKQLCLTLERSLIPSVNKPTILLNLTKFSVLPLCHFRPNSVDYWASPTVSRGSFICLPTLENGYNVQQKGFTIRNNGHKTTARVRRPAPQSLTMNKLGYPSILPCLP